MNPWASMAEPAGQEPASGDSSMVGMPVYLTPLIGRAEDRNRLRALFIEHGHRMVVITGSGGIGKTRLAVQVANDLQQYYRHGAQFLSFASIPPDADLDAVFAWHLGLRDVEHQSHRENIVQHLRSREQMLLLDNVEHLPRIADLLVFLHASCASLAMIITSRSLLGIYGEVMHRLYPLPVQTSGTILRDIKPARLMSSPAVQLFTERVSAVAPDFSITDENAADVAAICNHLGGIPLALELTAPHMVGRTPKALLEELHQDVDHHPTQLAHTLNQPASLRDTIRLSYDLLTEDEQRVFRILSIMRGHWSVEDVLLILTPEIDELSAISIIDTLVSRSLVYSPSAANEEMRFTINPVLRNFGSSLLNALDEMDAVADRHAERMITLAEEAEPELTGKYQGVWLVRIDALHEDFRGVHSHLRASNRPVDALRLSTALWRYGYTRGHYRQVRGWIETSLAETSEHDALRTRALNGIGFLANMTNDVAGTRDAHDRALALASQLNLHREIAVARIGLADLESDIEGHSDNALEHLRFAAEAYSHFDDPRGMASVLTNRGNIEWHSGDLDQAFTTHEEARTLYCQANDTRGVAWSDTNTGRIASQQGRFYDVVPRLQAALEAYISIGDAYGMAEIFEALAKVSVGTGDLTTASTLAGAATVLRETLGSPLKSPDLEEFEATVSAARTKNAHHDDAFEQGRQLDPDDAIALARSIQVPDPPDNANTTDHLRIAQQKFGITPREHQVLTLLREGLTDRQIAERLALSRRTVQTYNTSISHKLGAHSRVTAVHAAHKAGIMPHQQTRSTRRDVKEQGSDSAERPETAE